MDSLTRLQAFFRDLFQLDYADLDFGLYRIFHLKRREIDTLRFLWRGLAGPCSSSARWWEVSAHAP